MAMLRIVLPLPPGLLALNRKSERHTYVREGVTRRTIGARSEWAAAFDEAVTVIRQEVVRSGWRQRMRPAEVDIFVAAFWPEAKGDWDAPLKAISDALKAGLVYEDDSQVRDGTGHRRWNEDRPRIEILVEDVG